MKLSLNVSESMNLSELYDSDEAGGSVWEDPGGSGAPWPLYSLLAGKNYWALVLLLLCVLVVFGNVLVILSVAKYR